MYVENFGVDVLQIDIEPLVNITNTTFVTKIMTGRGVELCTLSFIVVVIDPHLLLMAKCIEKQMVIPAER